MARSVLILNGPNLNMLGVREPEVYGTETLRDVEALCLAHAETLGLEVEFRQTNHEGEMVDLVQKAAGRHAAIIVNAGAYTHTSVALLDALRSVGLPTVEVHLSNIHKREAYRHKSFVAEAAVGMIAGLGSHGYVLALDAVARLIETN